MHIHKEFFRYVIPSMLAFALSGIYAIADGFFVGNALGDNALAAINIAYPLTAFIQSIGTGIGMGGAIQYAICLGKQEHKRSSQYFGMAVLLLIVFSLGLTAVLSLGGGSILRLFGASGEILKLGEEYIRFFSYGALFQVLATGLVPFIRNMGGAVAAMAAMMAGFATNIVLDYLLVWQFPYGMMGAAVATVIGQAVTFLVCLGFLLKRKEKPLFHVEGEYGYISKRILAVGLSPFGLTFSPNITLILVNKSAALYGGDPAVTCYAAVSYISCVILLLLQGISDGSQPLISLSYGEKNLGKAKEVRNIAYRFSMAVAGGCVVLLFLCRGHIAALFGASEEVGRSVADILPVFLVGYLFISISRTTTSYFYATRENLRAYLLIYGEPMSLLLLLLIFPPILGIWGTWLAVPLSQFCVMIGSFFLLEKTGKRKLKKSVDK